jgi:hypothetical protein
VDSNVWLVIAIAVFVLLAVLQRILRGQARPFPYELIPIVTNAERSFLKQLQLAIGDEYLLFAKVRLADVIRVIPRTRDWQAHFNRITQKHLDFVLCDPRTLTPVAAVELDDSTHSRRDRQIRDDFVDGALAAARLPLVRIPTSRSYSPEALRVLVMEATAVQTVPAAR